ncbi:hypothetical protein DPMN_049132 [Dreissena polymorpha]|uniref:Uncharacterized protein n=1 Tax=Dreissena polymorpha TaxID=45954 RepID=A0A9D4I0U1_DREPO|nr:hypothetical protein DPMN_049132 [Dreissena polymorpha]
MFFHQKPVLDYWVSSVSLVLCFLSTLVPCLSQDVTTRDILSQLKCPEKCVCSADFSVFNCKNSFKSEEHHFALLTKELHLFRDFHGPILNGTFQNLYSLETINVSNSMVNFIQNGAFSGLTMLRKLILRGNSIQLMDNTNGLFKDNIQLEVLDLSHNHLNFIPDEPFRYLTNLKVLNMSYNHLKSARLGLRFQVTTQLSVIDFSGNDIENVLASDFMAIRSWEPIAKSINFSSCNLKSIEPDAIKSFKKLDMFSLANNPELNFTNMSGYLEAIREVSLAKLDLSYTNFSVKINLNDFTVENLGTLALHELNMAGNGLTSIDDNLLTFLNLRKLNLRDNKLQSIGVGIAKLGGLKMLDIAYNEITTVSEFMKDNVGNLEMLDLSNNKIGDKSGLDLAGAVKLIELDLSYNELENFVVPSTLANLKSLKLCCNKILTFNNGNPVTGLHQITHFDVSNNKLTSLNKFMFRDSRNIEVVTFANNEISTISHQTFLPHCPKIIDLSNNKVESVQHYGWHNVRMINLAYNVITNVDEQAFFFLHGLKELDLHGNLIEKLAVDTFSQSTNISHLNLQKNKMANAEMLAGFLKPLQNLKKIDLSYNNFTELMFDPSPFSYNFELTDLRISHNRINHVNPLAFSTIKNLKVLDFSRNPFNCGCENADVQKWLETTSVEIMNQENFGYVCTTPVVRGSRTLMTFHIRLFECNQNLFYIVIFSSIGGGSMLIAGTIATICFLVKRKRKGNLDIQSKNDESLDLLGYQKTENIKNLEIEPIPREDYVRQIRDNYIKGSASHTLVDVEFENPRLYLNPEVYDVKPEKKKKTEKQKLVEKEHLKKLNTQKVINGHKKPAIDPKKLKHYIQMYDSLGDSRLTRARDVHKLQKDRDNLKQFLHEMDKEYKKVLEKKKLMKEKQKKETEKKSRSRSRSKHSRSRLHHSRSHSRSRGNRELVRMVSLRQSRSMPDVLSYVNSLPRLAYDDREQQYRHKRVPIYHVDHYDPNKRHGWVRSMVDIPRVHRSSRDFLRSHSPTRSHVRRYESDMRIPYHRLKPEFRDDRIPHGYHTVSHGRHAMMIDSRFTGSPCAMERALSQQEVDHLEELYSNRFIVRDFRPSPTREAEVQVHIENAAHNAAGKMGIPNGVLVREVEKETFGSINAVNVDETAPKSKLAVKTAEKIVPVVREYNTIASTKGAHLGNGVTTKSFKPQRLERSASADNHLSPWV